MAACCCLSSTLQAARCLPPRGRAGPLPAAGCWLSSSVNQQTLPRAWSGLSTFLSALGRVWGRKSEALLIRVAWAGRPEAPGTTHMARHVWGPLHVSHRLCRHWPIFLLFLENVPPHPPWPAFNVCLTPQPSPMALTSANLARTSWAPSLLGAVEFLSSWPAQSLRTLTSQVPRMPGPWVSFSVSLKGPCLCWSWRGQTSSG